MQYVLFPSNPLNPRFVDDAYQGEADIAEKAGFSVSVVDIDMLLEGSNKRAMRFLQPTEGEGDTLIYRGWMLSVENYEALYNEALSRGYRMVTSPAEYKTAHWMPQNLPYLGEHTPLSLVVAAEDTLDAHEIALQAMDVLGNGPAIVKDFVKGRKHEWQDACFIPDVTNVEDSTRVIRNLIERQGDMLAGGVVVRKFETYVPIGEHPLSGMPLVNEWRRFYVDGKLVGQSPYWNANEALPAKEPAPELFAEIAASIPSPFFTLDLAEGVDGNWQIVELGDGQVAGIPEGVSKETLYTSLTRAERNRRRKIGTAIL